MDSAAGTKNTAGAPSASASASDSSAPSASTAPIDDREFSFKTSRVMFSTKNVSIAAKEADSPKEQNQSPIVATTKADPEADKPTEAVNTTPSEDREAREKRNNPEVMKSLRDVSFNFADETDDIMEFETPAVNMNTTSSEDREALEKRQTSISSIDPEVMKSLRNVSYNFGGDTDDIMEIETPAVITTSSEDKKALEHRQTSISSLDPEVVKSLRNVSYNFGGDTDDIMEIETPAVITTSSEDKKALEHRQTSISSIDPEVMKSLRNVSYNFGDDTDDIMENETPAVITTSSEDKKALEHWQTSISSLDPEVVKSLRNVSYNFGGDNGFGDEEDFDLEEGVTKIQSVSSAASGNNGGSTFSPITKFEHKGKAESNAKAPKSAMRSNVRFGAATTVTSLTDDAGKKPETSMSKMKSIRFGGDTSTLIGDQGTVHTSEHSGENDVNTPRTSGNRPRRSRKSTFFDRRQGLRTVLSQQGHERKQRGTGFNPQAIMSRRDLLKSSRGLVSTYGIADDIPSHIPAYANDSLGFLNEGRKMTINRPTLVSAQGGGLERSLTPHWSTEDKSERITIEQPFVTQMLRTNIPISVSYFVVLLGFLSQDNNENLQTALMWVLLSYIGVQTIATIAQAVPDNAVSTEEIDQCTTAIIYMSMVLYPCLGMWVLDHDKKWTLPGIENLWQAKSPETGLYTWGLVFPFLLWGLSALMFMRSTYSAFVRDTSGVVSDENGKPVTQLYRVIPGFWEIYMAKFCRISTMSLWHVLGEENKPGSHSGRFLFQLIGPVPIIFLYIGFRFIAFSSDRLRFLSMIGPLGNFVADRSNPTDFIISARMIIWSAFFSYTIILRAVLPSHLFLIGTVEDIQSLYQRSYGWQLLVAPTKRGRLLWGFRGFTLAIVPYTIHNFQISNGFRSFLYILYCMQYMSYLMEGVMAIFWALNEAARHCNLHHPLGLFLSIFYWCSFNAFLQPCGTLLNVFFGYFNGEGVCGVVFIEIWGPLIQRGNWRPSVRSAIDKLKSMALLIQGFGTTESLPINNYTIDKRLDDWIDTWRRKRKEVGKSDDEYCIVGRDSAANSDGEPIQVFQGTMFPTKEEWLSMRDHPGEHISLDLWNHSNPEEKFTSWYPTYQEEVLKLLKEPYNFDVKREIWMFGYGSLISPDCPPSGLTERQSKLLLPYWLKKSSGYKNSFSFRHGSCSINALGLIPVEEGGERQHVAGCVYPIDYEVACDLFAVREDGYEFLLVAVEHFKSMHPAYTIPDGVGYIWMCGAPTETCGDRFNNECDDWYCKRHVPTLDSPILQTYVDSIMAGALRYSTSGDGQEDGMRFCAAILSTIQDWDHPWYNDRILSGRPWVWRNEFQIIDGLLNTCPNTAVAFAKRMNPKIESPSDPRQMMIILDELRHQDWTSQFFGVWESEGNNEATNSVRRLSRNASKRLLKLRSQKP